jgi:hypothetical protein
MNECERYRPLLAGFLDQELTAEETVELNRHLIRCAGCRADLEGLRQLENRLTTISYLETGDKVTGRIWKLPYSALARNACLLMIIGGYASLLLYGLFLFLTSEVEPVFVRIAGAAIAVGFVVLLGILILERVTTYKADPYKEIER